MRNIIRLIICLFFILPIANLAQVDSSYYKERYADLLSFEGFGEKAKEVVEDNVQITGEIGAYGQLYGISGKDNRRPPATGRLFFRPTITLFNTLSLNFDFFLSTEGSAARQNINTIAVHPTWGWGTAHLGDFTHKISNYTLSVVQIRGGGLEIHPGFIRFEVIGGQTNRSVNASPYNSVFSQYLIGAKLGIGEQRGSHIDFNFLRARDDVASLPRETFLQIDSTVTNETTVYDTSRIGITPKENLVFGSNGQLVLFERSIKFKWEGALSLYSSDINGVEVEEKDIPEVLDGIYKPNYSTSVDGAYDLEMSYNSSFFNSKLGYEFIGPGYNSLGRASLLNDKRIIKGSFVFRFFEGIWNVRTNIQQQNDNVIGQKDITTTRSTYSVNTTIRAADNLNFALNSNINIFGNDSQNDTTKIDNSSLALSGNVNYRTELFSIIHVFNTGVNYQNYEIRNIIRGNSSTVSNTYNFGITSNITEIITSSISFSLNEVDMGNRGTTNNQSINSRVRGTFLDRLLQASIGWGYTNTSTSTINRITGRVSYKVFGNSRIVLGIRSSFFSPKTNSGISFMEYSTTLNYVYRF